jgi:hypothetical protein
MVQDKFGIVLQAVPRQQMPLSLFADLSIPDEVLLDKLSVSHNWIAAQVTPSETVVKPPDQLRCE